MDDDYKRFLPPSRKAYSNLSNDASVYSKMRSFGQTTKSFGLGLANGNCEVLTGTSLPPSITTAEARGRQIGRDVTEMLGSASQLAGYTGMASGLFQTYSGIGAAILTGGASSPISIPISLAGVATTSAGAALQQFGDRICKNYKKLDKVEFPSSMMKKSKG